MTNHELSRESLYEMVWTKPATRIASELGVKLAVVLKGCEILNVPRPSTGHWRKVEFGKTSARPALPTIAPGSPESITLDELCKRRRRSAPSVPALSVLPATSVESVSEPTKWHDAVKKTRAAFRETIADYKYGTLNPKGREPHLWIFVTRGCMARTFQLLNQLAWLLEANGFSFAMPKEGDSRIRLVHGPTDTVVDFFIKENMERYQRELKPSEKGTDPMFIWDRWRYRPTGKLRLIISEYEPVGGRKSWGDGKNTKLEDKLSDAVPEFVACAQGKHAAALAWKERQRQWAEEERRRREAEARERKEQEQRDVLFGAANAWRKAEDLQAFRLACEGHLRRTVTRRAANIYAAGMATMGRWCD